MTLNETKTFLLRNVCVDILIKIKLMYGKYFKMCIEGSIFKKGVSTYQYRAVMSHSAYLLNQ